MHSQGASYSVLSLETHLSCPLVYTAHMSLRRVCMLAQLRLNHTLKKKAVGGYMIDLSKQRDGHKTSRFYGPFAASLPDALTPVLDKYCAVLEFDDVSETGPYLFHPPQGSIDRAMESSAWSQWVSRCFQRHAGVAIAPKTLRSIFMCAHSSPSTQEPAPPKPLSPLPLPPPHPTHAIANRRLAHSSPSAALGSETTPATAPS